MKEGDIIIHGHAGDILGLSARGGRILVRDDVGYRAGIHMKVYKDKKPVEVIGDKTYLKENGGKICNTEAEKKAKNTSSRQLRSMM